jgi:hypothetical protein
MDDRKLWWIDKAKTMDEKIKGLWIDLKVQRRRQQAQVEAQADVEQQIQTKAQSE